MMPLVLPHPEYSFMETIQLKPLSEHTLTEIIQLKPLSFPL